MTNIANKHETYLDHAVWLKSNHSMSAQDGCTLAILMAKLEFLKNRTLDMATVEKIIYHYVVNDFSRSPYRGFNCTEYQNCIPESTDTLEEIKIMICKTCGLDTQHFHPYIQSKYNKFALKFSWVNTNAN